jgi:CubicO group peptidase (beta-lactamase class C family)
MLIRNGYELWQGDNIANRHVVWSCTKSFMSTCFGLLWDDGKCSPDTKVADIIPELAEHYPEATIEHFATFTSGYGEGSDDPAHAPPPMYAPGAAFHYSHQSNVLAAVLTRIAGESLNDLFQRRIGSIIGLTEADFHWGAQEIPGTITVNGGAGKPESAVQISARGMARFGWLFAQRGVWNGQQLISTRYIDYATVPRLNPPPPPHDLKAWYVDLPGRYGINWWVNGVDRKGERLWPSLPVSTFAAQGNKNNLCVIVPEWNLVLVRLGQDAIIDIGLFDPCFAQIGAALRVSGSLPASNPSVEAKP